MKHGMRKLFAVLIGCLLILSAVGASIAMAEGGVNFSTKVSGREGSVNLRTGAGTGYPVIREIPNGQILHIVDLSYNASDGFFFGKTDYQGSSGWVSLRQTTILTGNGYPAPDFQVRVSSREGSVNLRQGPGTGYPKIMEVPNGAQLHITNMQYNAGDDFFFGNTVYNGVNGWVSLRHTTFLGGSSPTPAPVPGNGSTPAVNPGTPSSGTPMSGPADSTQAQPQGTGNNENGSVIQFGISPDSGMQNNAAPNSAAPNSSAQNTGAQNTGAQNTGAQNTGAQNTGAQNTGAQNTTQNTASSTTPAQPAQLTPEAKAAYLTLLQNNKSLMEYSELERYYGGRIIAFEDITGDGVMEMLCAYVNYQNDFQNGYCRIASYQNGQLQFIKGQDGEDIHLFGPASDGACFPFMVKGNGHLFMKSGIGDPEQHCDRMSEDVCEDGRLKTIHSCYYNVTYGAEGYEIENAPAPASDVAAQMEKIHENISKVLFGSMEYYAFAPSQPLAAQETGMTYDEAIAYLQGQ